MLTEETVANFLQEMASTNPTPGGGSAAALSGAAAAALVSMVGRLSKKSDEHPDRMRDLIHSGDKYRLHLQALVSDDAAAFDRVMAAFKLPKANEDERQLRRQQLQQALLGAADVPMEVMESCLTVMELAYTAALYGKKNAVSDAGSAALLAHAGVQAAGYNVRINVSGLQDLQHRQQYEARLAAVLQQAQKWAAKTAIVIADRM